MASNSFSRAIKGLWEKKANQPQSQVLPGYNIQGQIDDVFLVLALMGEGLMPLQVFDEAKYDSTLKEVRFALSNCGNAVVEDIFNNMSGELQYLSVAALTVCAVFSPMHVFRGFGAAVHNDWDWGCPDYDYLEAKAKKSTSMFSKTPDPQPNRPILLAFDRAIQLLQMKSMTFLSRRPSASGLSSQQPRYTSRSRGDVLGELHTCRDWRRYVHRHGHPAPPGIVVSTWNMPFASWTSEFSCEMTHDFEQILTKQMDPGRLLHAFICRDALALQEGYMLCLPPGSPAEVLACWLAECPGAGHKIVTWDQFDSGKEGKLRLLDRKVMRTMGRYPLPNKFAVRDAEAVARPRPPVTTIPSFVKEIAVDADKPISHGNQTDTEQPPEYISELGSPDPVELDSSNVKDITRQTPGVTKTRRGGPSAFVTRPDEMPLSVSALERQLPPLPTDLDVSSDTTAVPNAEAIPQHMVDMHDVSAIPSPLRLKNPRSFAAELPAEPFESKVARSATNASTVSSATGATPTSSFSPVSPLTPIIPGSVTYRAMPAPKPLDVSASRHMTEQGSVGTNELSSELYLEYGRAASG